MRNLILQSDCGKLRPVSEIVRLLPEEPLAEEIAGRGPSHRSADAAHGRRRHDIHDIRVKNMREHIDESV